MIDCGHNATTGWKPGTYLRQQNLTTLDMLAVTNYDEDHASGAKDLFDNIDVRWLWRNKSVSGAQLKQLKSDTGTAPGIECLCHQIDNVFTGGGPSATSPHPAFQGLRERACFYNNYPKFDDENNLSMAIYLNCHGHGVMFTGDLEKPGFAELLKDENFRQALRSTNVYLASHHGRESGCSEDVAALLTNVYYVVISDKGYEHETQNTIAFYRKIAKGGPFRDEGTRHVLTTRNDGRIGFDFSSDSWGPYEHGSPMLASRPRTSRAPKAGRGLSLPVVGRYSPLNRRHTGPGSGADAPPRIRLCGRDIPGGSCRSTSPRTNSAAAIGERSAEVKFCSPAPGDCVTSSLRKNS
jgi:beta-lactamase superfamily II metal-dependent hydrolase